MDIKLAKFEDGNEIVGSIDVVKVKDDSKSSSEYKLELRMDEDLTREILKYGADSTNQVDLLQTGIRNGLINRIAGLREN